MSFPLNLFEEVACGEVTKKQNTEGKYLMEELDKVSREERDDFRKHYEQIHEAFHITNTTREPADHHFPGKFNHHINKTCSKSITLKFSMH